MVRVAAVCLLVCLLNTLPFCLSEDTGALTVIQTDDNDGVTVEENGEDPVKAAHNIEPPTSQFQPTDQWQQVKEGQSIPAGLHVRLNMETGEREAKLMEGDSGLKYWKEGDREGMMNTNKQRFSVDELKRALKDFKTTKLDDTDLQREEDVKSKFRSYAELKQDFQAMNVGVKTDGQIIDELVKKMKSKDIEHEELLTILTDLEYYLHQIDNAVIFRDYGGLPLLVQLLNSTNFEDVKVEAAMVLGAATSSNPPVQISAIESGALHILLKMISTEPSMNVRKKVLYAISTICRNFPYAQKTFLQLGGLSALGQMFKEFNAVKLKIKAIAFLNDLLVEKDDAEQYVNKDKSSEVERLRQYSQVELREAMLEQGWCDLVPELLTVSQHDSREHVLKSMKTLSATCTDKFVRFRTNLSDLKRQYEELALEEKDIDDDQYFSQMLTLVEEIVSDLNVKEEL